MTVNTNSERTSLTSRQGFDARLADAEDISGGVAYVLGETQTVTLFLKVTEATAVDVTVELSPDGGSTWYEASDESPVSVASNEQDKAEHIPYNATHLRISANNQTPVTAQVREVV